MQNNIGDSGQYNLNANVEEKQLTLKNFINTNLNNEKLKEDELKYIKPIKIKYEHRKNRNYNNSNIISSNTNRMLSFTK